MRVWHWLLGGSAVMVAVVASGAALGAGPWPGLARAVVAPSGDVRYSAIRAGSSTKVTAYRIRGGKILRSARFSGAYGIPAVTTNGLAGGLSPDGRLLVLAEPPNYQGLREQSRFLVVSTNTLTRAGKIVLKGEFGFDALSPDGRTLYLIQHRSSTDLVSYVVRAYDLRAKRLLAGVVVDKRQADERMRGYPVARATSADGSWVYTLYHRGNGKPFIHALDAARRTAFCIDLPWSSSIGDVWGTRLALTSGDRQLVVQSASGTTVATIDTKTLQVH